MSGKTIPPRGLLIGTAQSWKLGTYDVLIRDKGQRGIAAEIRYVSHEGLKVRTGASMTMPIGVARAVGTALINAADEAESLSGGADVASDK